MTDQTDSADAHHHHHHQQQQRWGMPPVTRARRGIEHLVAEGVMPARFARARWPESVPVADLRLPLGIVEPEQRVPTAAAEVRPVVLVRYRPGVTGETARTVHVVPLPTDGQAGVVGALCGAALMLGDVETVNPGEGMPCIVCVLTHVTGTALAGEPPAGSPDGVDAAGFAAGGACYQQWDWPVIVHRDQVQLSLSREVSALAIPVALGTEVTQILTQRRCAPAVLAHPYAPEHRIVLTGERYGVTLPWPAQVHWVTGVLLLPPTVTRRGPITWIQPPRADSLHLCREIDLFGALRTALSPPTGPSAHSSSRHCARDGNFGREVALGGNSA